MIAGDYFILPKLKQNKATVLLNENYKREVKDAELQIKVLGLVASKVSSNFIMSLDHNLENISGGSKQSTDSKTHSKISLDVEFIGAPNSRKLTEITDEISKAGFNTILVLAPDVVLLEESKSLINEKKIPTILFSADSNIVCSNGKKSNFIWNFGIASTSYTETFLSFINQKFSKLAQDLKIFLYVNDKPWLDQQADQLVTEIDALGLKVAGRMVVDERTEDIYSTVRQIYDYDPKVILGVVSRKGLRTFLPVAAKIGFTYEMGVAFTVGVFEEDLIDLGDVSRGVIIPTPYVSELKLSRDKKKIESENDLTASGYQGDLVAGILEKLLFRQSLGSSDMAKKLEELDGVQYLGLSGLVTVDSKTHGLIQPLHVAEFRDGSLKHVQYLGDVSLAPDEICN